MRGFSLLAFAGVVVALASGSALAIGDEATQEGRDTASPVGRWKTIDDVTGKAKSIIAIREEDGVLLGRIEELLDTPPHDPNPRCDLCKGDLKDKPILGMQILWGLRRDGDKWSGGRVLDPDNGKTYRCHLALEDGGRKLRLRGFIGVSLLGRTQYWLREE